MREREVASLNHTIHKTCNTLQFAECPEKVLVKNHFTDNMFADPKAKTIGKEGESGSVRL
jgi:hypothetical protein